jgi:UDP-N-acetylglucosamine:LPS N-acetylglucosamine transferase
MMDGVQGTRGSGRVVVLSASVGGGHDGAAGELARRLRAAGLVVDRCDYLDLLPAAVRRLMRDGYRRQLNVAPATFEWMFEALQRSRRLANVSASGAALAGTAALRVIGTSCALVVSTYPAASHTLGWLRRSGRLSTPTVTYLTDLSAHRLWVASGIDIHLALHPLTASQARELGASDVRVVAPAVAPAFAAGTGPDMARRDAARRRFGLPADGRLALLTTGSWGIGEVESSAADITGTGVATPVVACGRNDALRERIARTGAAIALGWIDDMPALLRACDVVVQNAGGLSSLEAMAAGLPVVTHRPVPGHGLTNAEALDAAGLAAWVRRPDLLAPVLHDVLDGPAGHHQAAAARRLFAYPDPAEVLAQLAAQPMAQGA